MLKLISKGFRASRKLLNEVEVFIDGNSLKVDSSYTILQACQKAGITVPHFCFHERLAVAGNCRMCLVEVEKMPKPAAACAMPVMNGMRINTKSEYTYNARGGVMEFLLANHPLDCPICDQGGECDLQDQSVLYGYREGRFLQYKRAVEDKEIGPLISTIMTRCIHCTRCIRFSEEIAGMPVLGTTGRGRETQVGTYVEKLVTSQLSGNLVDLCPVGALTNAPYAFTARPWELREINTFCTLDSIAPATNISVRGPEVMRILPRIHEEINEEWIHDRSRHSFDGLKRQRLNACLRRRPDGSFEELLWQDAMEYLSGQIYDIPGDQIMGMIGYQVDAEGAVAFRDLMYKLGVENIQCNQQWSKISPDFRANYLMNSRIEGLQESDLVLLVGVNPKIDSPVLNARIRRNVIDRDMKVAIIGTGDYQGYEFQHLGTSSTILKSLLEETHPYCQQFSQAKLPIILISSSILKRPDGEALVQICQQLAQKYNVINLDQQWNGLGILHQNLGNLTALQLGIPSQASPQKPPKFIYLLGEDSFRRSQIPDDAFVVYQGTHGDQGANRANLIFPAAAYTEKSGTYVNTDGRVIMTRVAVGPPGQARSDWEILRALSEVLRVPLPYDSYEEIRFRLAELAPHLVKYDYIEPYNQTQYTKAAKGEIVKSPLVDTVDNFYMNDPISRSSPVMARCSESFNPVRNTNFTQQL